MSYPKVTADLARLCGNVNAIAAMCHAKGITMAAVTKCVLAEPAVIAALNETAADFLADSRVQNLAGIRTDKPRILIRIPMLSEAEAAVACSEMSLNSEMAVIRALGDEAARQNRPHKIILMVDMGDLREGIFYENEALIRQTAEEVLRHKALTLYGVGVNFSCFGGIMPDEKNLAGLLHIASLLRSRYSLELPLVSGGNSSSMGLLRQDAIPAGITNLRVGEAYLLWNDTSDGSRMPDYTGSAFTLSAELVEVQDKPSKPVGVSSINAFGERVEFPDRGPMRRGILALGRQDTETGGLTPLDPRIEVLGASSDHTLVNLTGLPEYRVGDTVDFSLDYGALLKVYTSKYIQKEYL